MCSVLPGSLFLSPLRHFSRSITGICLYSSNSNKLSDILLLSRLWKRTPLFIGNNSSEHEQPWSISRGSRLTHLDIRDRMCCVHDVKRIVLLPERHDGMFAKLFHSIMWYFTARKIKRLLKYFPCEENEALEHILEGNKHLFKLILDSVLKKDFGRLGNGTLGKNTLDFHRDAASKLTEAQRNSLKIAADDLIGENGFFKNWGAFLTTSELITGYLHSPEFNITKDATGQPLDKPVVKYSVQLLALLKKKELFKKVCHDLKSTVPITMPSNYGYRVPRYIIMEIEICHEMDENPSDALLFDFHIISFANVYDSGAMEKRIKNNIR